MSGNTPAAKGPAPVHVTTSTPGAKPDNISSLSLEYRDGQPVIVASGGTHIPASITVVDGSKKALAAYVAGEAISGHSADYCVSALPLPVLR
ncbi:hypothetical protein [Streptomyces sp. NPDC002215]|uniref:hypothetical protein n=1 Tax=Streptomyces sp. NPDC002215 TaxID=3154412 RepID=UPI00332473AE